MLQPLMVLWAAATLAATGATSPRCEVVGYAEQGLLVDSGECTELERLRAERDRLLQRLGEAPASDDGQSATGGSGEEGLSEPPEVAAPPPTAAQPPAPPPALGDPVSEELRALRQEVEHLRQAVEQTEARLPPVAPAKAVEAEPVQAGPDERERALELLRNTDTLTVQNASPLERQVLGEVTVANRTQGGEAGFVLQPQVRVGTPWKVEVGAGAQLQNLAGAQEGTTGAVGAYALGQLVEERRAVPQVALKGEVLSPQGDEGLSAEARVLATKRFGQTRLHGNVGYRVTQDAADDYMVGLAADHPIGDRLLLQGDAYFMDPLGREAGSINASVGTGVRVGSAFVVTGAVGVNATAVDVAPRLLLGVVGRI